jgi:hypothetical protein
MIISNNGVHVFIFVAAEYLDLLDRCLNSIRDYVIDDIASVNIVTNTSIVRDDCTVIKDRDFWRLIDPDFKFRKLYNHNWYKQQFFKLSVDKYISGNALIIDAEVVFTGHTQFIHNGKVDIYVDGFFYTQSDLKFSESFKNFNKTVLDIDMQCSASFVTEAMIFSTEVLKNIRKNIEIKHKKAWLEVMSDFLLVGIEKNDDYTLSEYELYGNYFLINHKNLLNRIVHVSPQNFITKRNDKITSNNGGKTKWLTFYEQIRGPEWPDCDNEQDFVSLPEKIQKECIDQFGYNPDLHGGEPNQID